jgi:hypothetical protein
MKNIRKTAVVACVVAGALVGGVGATTANAQPVVVSTTSVGANHLGPLGHAASPVSPQLPAPSNPAPEGNERIRIPIGSIVNWIKSNAPSIIPALKNALRSGINAFKNWWNGLAGWIRTAISGLAQMSLQELFSELWHYFFG